MSYIAVNNLTYSYKWFYISFKCREIKVRAKKRSSAIRKIALVELTE